MKQNRFVTLAQPVPQGQLLASHFSLRDRDIPSIGDGQLLLRPIAFSVDPAMRGEITGWDMVGGSHQQPAIPLRGRVWERSWSLAGLGIRRATSCAPPWTGRTIQCGGPKATGTASPRSIRVRQTFQCTWRVWDQRTHGVLRHGRSEQATPGRDSLGVQRRRPQLAINHHDTVVDRTELTGVAGVRIWLGHGVSAHNLVEISTLAA
jgi:N-terminal domain of oxidoreductase